MTTTNLYAASLPDHSNTDESALEWAGSGVLADCETSEQTINTNAWREVGTVDSGTITVWHDGCESYVFEALVLDVVGELQSGNVTADNLAEWTTAALEIDWDAAYEATRVDDEPTDASSDLGDALEAIYWYGVHCHDGQSSDLYRLQCAVGEVFTPGPISNGPEPESSAMDMYRTLCEAAGCGDDSDGEPTPPQTPGDFEPEITLAAGNIVVRMQYRDGGGSDRRGDYRFEITASGLTWYGDDLQSARCGFDHAADSVEAFMVMACSMLSFVTTDDPEADYRAPDAMQDALESAVCEVSVDEDGSDDPSGWAVVD